MQFENIFVARPKRVNLPCLLNIVKKQIKYQLDSSEITHRRPVDEQRKASEFPYK